MKNKFRLRCAARHERLSIYRAPRNWGFNTSVTRVGAIGNISAHLLQAVSPGEKLAQNSFSNSLKTRFCCADVQWKPKSQQESPKQIQLIINKFKQNSGKVQSKLAQKSFPVA